MGGSPSALVRRGFMRKKSLRVVLLMEESALFCSLRVFPVCLIQEGVEV